MHVWFRTATGALVIDSEVESMAEARRLARDWNKEASDEMSIATVCNAELPAAASKVSTVYSVPLKERIRMLQRVPREPRALATKGPKSID